MSRWIYVAIAGLVLFLSPLTPALAAPALVDGAKCSAMSHGGHAGCACKDASCACAKGDASQCGCATACKCGAAECKCSKNGDATHCACSGGGQGSKHGCQCATGDGTKCTCGRGDAGSLPPPDGKALWTYMTQTSPYSGWGYWPGRYGMYEGTEPHGAQVKIYANGPALRAAREGKPMPAGAIVVKENYGKDGKALMAVTPMYKVTGYNPEGGDWFWAKYNADGRIDKEGKVGGCIKCHEAAKDQNWIFNKAK